MINQETEWHHAPLHRFVPGAVYMVTAGTLYKKHIYKGRTRLQLLQESLFSVLNDRHWELQAWAVFSNHYHFIAKAPEENSTISRLIQHLHSIAGRHVNEIDGTPGRKVWYQYWDKCLTFEKSFYVRLNYVIHNAQHHGLVHQASQYPFCSAGHFERNHKSAFRNKVRSFKHDRLNEPDAFEPMWAG